MPSNKKFPAAITEWNGEIGMTAGTFCKPEVPAGIPERSKTGAAAPVLLRSGIPAGTSGLQNVPAVIPISPFHSVIAAGNFLFDGIPAVSSPVNGAN